MSFEVLAAGFAARFGAPVIRADRLLLRLKQPAPTLLVDVREQVEQEVSALPGALLARPKDDLSLLPPVRRFYDEHRDNPDARIVLYCAGGYRSARSYAALPPDIRSLAVSLHGGIVAYVNEGGTVVDPSGNPVQAVHSYNGMWASFVKEPYRAVTEPKVR